MKGLVTKISHENKKSIIAGDFNLNFLKCTQIKGIHEFLHCLLRKNFLPQITLLTGVEKQKTASLIDVFTNSDKNLKFDVLLCQFDKMLGKYYPFKTFRKKQTQNMKPCVTSGIQKSIKIRNKIYKQMIILKTKPT